MSLEEELSRLNEYFFYKEFTFSNTQFRTGDNAEVELADGLILLGRSALVFQMKERQVRDNQTTESERNWFERKVKRKAVSQIRDTLRYLAEHPRIPLTNHRQHAIECDGGNLEAIHKLIVYSPSPALPADCRMVKSYVSETAGTIHLISGADYLGIVQTLITPAELMEYLSFRKEVLERWPEESSNVPEVALLGHYLRGNMEQPPCPEDFEMVAALDHSRREWDVSPVIRLFADRITTPGGATEYYPIITAIAELKRNELSEFKKRFDLSVENARNNEFALPYRIAVPRTGCGFVFIPLESDFIPRRQEGLRNITLAHKYDQRLPRCVGVSFAPDERGWYELEWMYVESHWEPSPEMDRLLAENFPFRRVRVGELNRYRFIHD